MLESLPQPEDKVKPDYPEGMTVIPKTDQKLDLINDPQSPWQSADADVKKFFQQVKERQIAIKDITHEFQKKPGKSNICTFFFPPGGEYFTCQDCCKNGGAVIMCFCLPCWDQSKHLGHNFDRRVAWSNSAYCDCGWDDRIKPQSFCNNHGSKQQLEVSISEQERKKFYNFFAPLFKIGLYLTQNVHHDNPQQNFWGKISKIIIQLCESSIFYIRLLYEILEEEIIYGEQKFTILEALLRSRHDHENMLFRITGDRVTKIKLAKIFSKLLNSKNWNASSNYSTLIKDCFTESDVLLELAEKQIFINKYEEKYIDLAQKHPQRGEKILFNYLLHQKKQKENTQFFKFMISFWSNKGGKLLFKNQQFKKFLLQQLFPSFDDQQSEINNKEEDNAQSSQRNILITQIISNICQNNPRQIINFQNRLEQFKISKERFDKFLVSCMKTSKRIIYKYEKDKNYQIIPIILMASASQSKKQLIHNFWESVTKQNDSLRQDFIETIDVLYHLIALINSYQSHILNEKQAKQQDNIEAKIKWFKSYLYENGKVERDELLKMRNQGNKLKFKDAGKILKQLCKYREESDSFEYISQQKYPNYQMKFKVRDRSNRGNFRAIPNGNFSLENKIQIPQNEITSIFDTIFSHPNFIGTFKNKWWDKVKVHENDDRRINFWKNYDLGYYYTLIIVCAKQFMNTTNEEVDSQIRRIQEDKKLLEQLTSFNSSSVSMKKLLSIKEEKISPKKVKKTQQETVQMEQKIQSPMKSEQQEESAEGGEEQQIQAPQLAKNHSLQERRQKFKKKKLEKYAKIKEKRNIMLNKNQSKTEQEADKNEQGQEIDNQQCLLCHEKSKKDMKLLYLGNIEKDNTLSSSFHGNQDKSNVLFSSCFHPVHPKCYLQIQKREMQFNCPLCAKKSNMIFPIDCSNEQQLKKCQNVINALFVVKFKSLSFTTLIDLLFKHLVESYGLNTLIYIPKYLEQKKQRRKMDQFVFKILKNLYKINNREQQLKNIYQNFADSLHLCKNQLVRDVQLLLSNTVYNLLSTQKIDLEANLIQKIQKELQPTEFQLLIQSLQHLTEKQITLPAQQSENNQVKQKKIYKNLSFHVAKLPQTSDQLQNWHKDLKCKCGAKRQIICLVTCKGFCSNNSCESLKQHTIEYKQNLILLKISQGKVIVSKKRSGKRTEDIYYDPFMLPYSDKNKGYSEQIYELNTLKFNKITQNFFEIQ